MKNQVLPSSKDKSKKVKCRLLQFLFGELRMKTICLRLFHLHQIINRYPHVSEVIMTCFRLIINDLFSPN